MLLLFLFTLFSPGYVSISHEFILSRCSRAVLTCAQLAGGLLGVEQERMRERLGQYICILPYVKHMCCNQALYHYVCIYQYVTLVRCSRALYTWTQLVGGGCCPPVLGMSIFVNKLYWFGVVGPCTLGVDQQGRASSLLNRLYWFGVVGLCTLGHPWGEWEWSVCTGYVHMSQ